MQRNDELIRESCNNIKHKLLVKFSSIADQELEAALDDKLKEWSNKSFQKIENYRPLMHEFRALENSKNELSKGICNRESIEDDIDNYKAIREDLDVGSWMKRINSTRVDDLYELRSEVIGEWEQELDRQNASMILDEIDKERNEFIRNLEEWLNLIKSIKNSLDSLGMGPGYLWDLSTGNLSHKDIETLKQWANAFRNDSSVRKICEILGRMNSQTESKESHVEREVSYSNTVPDFNSKKEVCGIELGKDLDNVLPSELTQLNDPDLDILFTLKYAENRLMCFSKQGYREEEEFRTEIVTITEEEKQTGPIIFCIDTSGSMHGTPEYIAKAVALYISMKAIGQKRNCYLINFSTDISTIDLTPPKGISDLLKFMGMSFNGGTDPLPAMERAIQMTNEESYRLADIIMISDFIMPPDAFSKLKSQIEESKSRKCKYHSLTIGNFAYSDLAMKDVFDEMWIYDTADSSVRQVDEMVRSLNSKRYRCGEFRCHPQHPVRSVLDGVFRGRHGLRHPAVRLRDGGLPPARRRVLPEVQEVHPR